MNNEEKILSILEQMQGQMNTMNDRLEKLEQGQAEIREELDVIKEDTAITREATNTLLDWAEKAEVQIRIPLYNKEA
jgi:predicted nuclease with TOPRIM domain